MTAYDSCQSCNCYVKRGSAKCPFCGEIEVYRRFVRAIARVSRSRIAATVVLLTGCTASEPGSQTSDASACVWGPRACFYVDAQACPETFHCDNGTDAGAKCRRGAEVCYTDPSGYCASFAEVQYRRVPDLVDSAQRRCANNLTCQCLLNGMPNWSQCGCGDDGCGGIYIGCNGCYGAPPARVIPA